MSRVLTRKRSPAPSQSLEVMMGVLTQKKPLESKYRCVVLGQRVAHPGHCAERIRARAQVRDGTQVFERVALLRDGIGVGFGDPTGHLDVIGLDFPGLAPTLGSDDAAADLDGASGSERDDLIVVGEILVRHDLQRIETRAVVHVNEGETAPRSTPGPDPASDRNRVSEGDVFVNNG